MNENLLTEKDILKFWKENKIYEKVKSKNRKGKKFYFADGPPYATGSIHMGTALNKILKDISMRYKRSKGFDVFDRPGYDTHGLPIENKVEKKLGFSKKEDIEKYGVAKFVAECKKFATEFIDLMNEEFVNLGVWMDFNNPYLTLDNQYIETIWETFKQAEKKGLLYLGRYPIHSCPHCETAVAYNEIEYTKQEDEAIYVKFQLKNEKNKYLVIFTTTPWTLPSNTGIMVNPKFDYAEIKVDDEIWVIAKERVKDLFDKLKKKYKIEKILKGKELGGLEYQNPLKENLKLPELKNAYKVILNERYVNLEEGTGLVHTAPGCGKEDFDAGQKSGLPTISIVKLDGTLEEEAGKYAGKKARVVDKEIIEDLEKDNFIVFREKYNHEYPICWRCKSPLILISVPQWFFRISKIHKSLIKSNKEVNWVPKYMKTRMGAWLEGISDWPISRNRYWGTPLPIWVCDSCDERIIISSIKELEKKTREKIKEIHKPEIDKITWKCRCGGKMMRVPEVLDVWFDSGVSSWAELNYPKTDKLFKKFWPADLNIEGKDQFRGWWNSQLILSEIRFGKKPYENILVHGMVLSIGKVKMSKSLGNSISPHEVIEKYGRDLLRYYLSKTSKGEDFTGFDEKEFRNVQNVFRVLTNVNNYINQLDKKKSKLKLEDKWILSRLNNTLKSVSNNLDEFRFPEAIQILERFLIDDLSKTYIKMIREREEEIFITLNEIRNKILIMLAPIMPFITESIWQGLKKKGIVKEESIHLVSWPKPETKKIDKTLEVNFENLLKIIEKGLAERDKFKIGLRRPLVKATIYSKYHLPLKEFSELIKSQLNIKDFELKANDKSNESRVELDTTMTPELKAEWYSRELSRLVQSFRKKRGLQKHQKVELGVYSNVRDSIELFQKKGEFITQRTNSRKITFYYPGEEHNLRRKFEYTMSSVIDVTSQITIGIRISP